jgi:hypothetical protein
VKRRGFLQFLGLAAPVAALPTAAEKFAATAKQMDLPPAPVEPQPSTRVYADDYSGATCCTVSAYTLVYEPTQRKIIRVSKD